MAKEKKTEETKDEEYLKYVMKDNTINITIKAGGLLVFQSGNPTPPPKPPGGNG